MARKKYPSDHRRWFRVMEDVLHHPKIRDVGHYSLATLVKILAVANQRKAHETGGEIELDGAAQMLVTGKFRTDAARRELQHLANFQLIVLEHRQDIAAIRLPNYTKKQGMTPRTTPTPTPTTKREVVASSKLGEPLGAASSSRPGSPEVFFGEHPLALAHPAPAGGRDPDGFVGEAGDELQEWTGPESAMEPKQH